VKTASCVRKELRDLANQAAKGSVRRFFKEKIKTYGVKTPLVRGIARKYFPEIRVLEKRRIFSIVEELLKSGYNEDITVAFDWVYRGRKNFERKDFVIFENWLNKYVANWGTCDDFGTHIMGYFLFRYPEFLKKTEKWAGSKNRWLRRAAAVSLIYSLRRGRALDRALTVADRLLADKDDLVRKGYSWMLKEASKIYQPEVFEFVTENKKVMPRVALRYAIEKMPRKMKEKAMS
jgi:3-methyladenine DNA glycosylase AlkD